MRIRGWSIAGYGVLRELTADELPDGLTIVHGPNEAGKSTLLRFLREMLFAPWSGRGSTLGMPPPSGGAHGGRLWLEAEGERYTLEKHLQGRRTSARLLDAEGRELDESVLRALLGGVDRGVFEGVFAFDHAELAELGRLTRSRVREEIFSATITGAGRSARAALEALERRALELLRPRSGGQLNELLERSRALREKLDAARVLAAKHRELVTDERRLSERIETIRGQQQELRREQWWLGKLLEVRQALDRIESIRAERDTIETDTTLAELAPRIDALVAESARIEEAERRLDELETQHAGVERELVLRLAGLGHQFDEARLAELSSSSKLGQELSRHEQELGELRAALKDAEEAASRAAAAISDARAERDERKAVAAVLDADGPSKEQLLSRRRLLDALGEVRAELAAAERAAEDRAERLHEARIRALEASRRARLTGLAGPIWLAAAAVATAAGWLASRADWTPAALLAIAAAVIAGFGLWVRRLARASAEDTTGREEELAAAAEHAEEQCEQLRDDVSALCRELGVNQDATARDLAKLRASCDAEIERCSRTERALDALEEAERAFQREEERGRKAQLELERIKKEVDRADGRWRAWLAAQRLPAGLEPSQLRETLAEAAKAVELSRRRAEILRERELSERRIDDWKRAAAAVLGDAGESASASEATVGQLAAWLRRLQQRANENSRRIDSARSLDRSLERAGLELDRVLAGVPGADRLREEAEAGHVDAWRQRLGAIDRELADTEAALEQPRERLAVVRDERDRLEASSELAELEIELDAVTTEIATLLREWRVVQTARQLVADALEDYQRSHQPEVLAAASEAFRTMTGGRYERVVQAGETFAVLDSRGGRRDTEQLSQGTAEQLYLAVRFGLARYLSKRGMQLPFVMDDVLVNFDPERRRAAAELIAELSRERQVFFFSCHPTLVELLAGASGDARVIEMEALPVG